MCIMEEFEKIKTRAEHQGYFYKVSDVINNDIRVAVQPKDNGGDTRVGKFEANK